MKLFSKYEGGGTWYTLRLPCIELGFGRRVEFGEHDRDLGTTVHLRLGPARANRPLRLSLWVYDRAATRAVWGEANRTARIDVGLSWRC